MQYKRFSLVKVLVMNCLMATIVFINCENKTTSSSEEPDDYHIVYDSLIDVRDGQVYRTVEIGSQTWMADNLNIGIFRQSVFTRAKHSDCHNDTVIEKYAFWNDTTYLASYGGLYDWHEAMYYDTTESSQGICPEGWHIPSDSEWKILEAFIGISEGSLDETGPRGTNQALKLYVGGSTGFNVQFSGSRNLWGIFSAIDTMAYYWCSSLNVGTPWARAISSSGNSTYADVSRSACDAYSGFCIRCVKD